MIDQTKQFAADLLSSGYASWRRYCIEVKYGLSLTLELVQADIAILDDANKEESRCFSKLYGQSYREQVLARFQQTAADG
ncbi:MAG: hypothetical protein GKR95_17810 [Gammaproteobacteria bacterium]|nr:hypothetical protein [Gammaproteobacteria bacterium]